MLTGPEWLVLQAVQSLLKDQYGFVHEGEIAKRTDFDHQDVRKAWRS